MFWNKKVRYEKYDKDTERIYAVSENLAKRINNQEAKLDLILDHLELKYVPETKEPAKLVEETRPTIIGSETFLTRGGGSGGSRSHSTFGNESVIRFSDGFGGTITAANPPPPKKRGRPKKKPKSTGTQYIGVPSSFIITSPAKRRGRPKKK